MSNANAKRNLPQHALRRLKTEINFWLDNSLIDAETAARLRALYAEAPGAPSTAASADGRDAFSRFLVFATATLGALALGIALYFILSLTWENLGKSCKIGVLLGSLAVVYLGGFAARAFKRPNFSAALFFLGAFVFGLSVWQFAEIFQFEIALPTGYWLWGALAFGVAFFGDRAPTHYLAAALLVVWTIAEITFARPTPFSPALLSATLPNAAYSLPIFAALGYRWGVRHNASGVQLLYALLGVFWATLQYSVWMESRDAATTFFFTFYLFFLAGLVYFASLTLVANHFVASKLRLLSVATLYVCLLISSRFWFYEHSLLASFSYSERLATLVFFAVCGTVALATFFLAWRKRPALFAKGPNRRALFVSPVGVAILTVLPFLYGFFGADGRSCPACLDAFAAHRETFGLVAAAWTNVLVLAVAGVAFLVGAFRSAGLYWFGVFYFLIWLTIRYFAFDLDDATVAACFFGAISFALFGAAFFLAKLRARLDAATEAREVDETNKVDETNEVNGADVSPTAETPQVSQTSLPRQTAQREPAFVAFLAAAFDAPTAADDATSDATTPGAPAAFVSDAPATLTNRRRFKTCALTAAVVAQFAILGFIAFEANRPFVPVESFAVEAVATRAYHRDSNTFGRDRDEPYLSLEYPFADLQVPERRVCLGVALGDGDKTPVVKELDDSNSIYVVLRRASEAAPAWATRITSKPPTSLDAGEILLVGRRERRPSKRTTAKATFPDVEEFPLTPELKAAFDETAQHAPGSYSGSLRVLVKLETTANGDARVVDVEILPPSEEAPVPLQSEKNAENASRDATTATSQAK